MEALLKDLETAVGADGVVTGEAAAEQIDPVAATMTVQAGCVLATACDAADAATGEASVEALAVSRRRRRPT
jgi:hypothetical protein